MVYLSEQGQISIDAYLADVETGQVRRTLGSTAADPHFDNLQFLEAAGAFDATGQRFALAAIRRGRPELVILDAARGKRLQGIPLGRRWTRCSSRRGRPTGGASRSRPTTAASATCSW